MVSGKKHKKKFKSNQEIVDTEIRMQKEEEFPKTALAQKAANVDIDKIMDKGYKEAKPENEYLPISEQLRNKSVIPDGDYDLPFKVLKFSGDDVVKIEKILCQMKDKGFKLLNVHTIYNGASIIMFEKI